MWCSVDGGARGPLCRIAAAFAHFKLGPITPRGQINLRSVRSPDLRGQDHGNTCFLAERVLPRTQVSQDSQRPPARTESVHASAMQLSESADGPLTSAVPPSVIVPARRRNPLPNGSHEIEMTLFMISLPLMVLAVALAVLPLILISLADHRRRTAAGDPPRPASVLEIANRQP